MTIIKEKYWENYNAVESAVIKLNNSKIDELKKDVVVKLDESITKLDNILKLRVGG